jgi:hypothetical protein
MPVILDRSRSICIISILQSFHRAVRLVAFSMGYHRSKTSRLGNSAGRGVVAAALPADNAHPSR